MLAILRILRLSLAYRSGATTSTLFLHVRMYPHLTRRQLPDRWRHSITLLRETPYFLYPSLVDVDTKKRTETGWLRFQNLLTRLEQRPCFLHFYMTISPCNDHHLWLSDRVDLEVCMGFEPYDWTHHHNVVSTCFPLMN